MTDHKRERLKVLLNEATKVLDGMLDESVDQWHNNKLNPIDKVIDGLIEDQEELHHLLETIKDHVGS